MIIIIIDVDSDDDNRDRRLAEIGVDVGRGIVLKTNQKKKDEMNPVNVLFRVCALY